MQHIAINFTRIIKAFITFRDAPGGPAAFFHQLSEFTQIFGSAVYVAQTLIGDSVVVRRFRTSPGNVSATDCVLGGDSCTDATWSGAVTFALSQGHSSSCWGAQVRMSCEWRARAATDVSWLVTACGVGILYSFARVVPEAEIFVAELQHWIVAFFSLTLTTNIICTSEPLPSAGLMFANEGTEASSLGAYGG